jgi:hypothetical protein
MCALDRECHLMRLRAETFAFELLQEKQVRSEGGNALPEEWVAHLEREREKILVALHQNGCTCVGVEGYNPTRKLYIVLHRPHS